MFYNLLVQWGFATHVFFFKFMFSMLWFGRMLNQMIEKLASFVSMRQGILYESQR